MCEVMHTYKRDYSVRPKGGFKLERRDHQGSLRLPKQQPSGTWSTAHGKCSRCSKQHTKSDIYAQPDAQIAASAVRQAVMLLCVTLNQREFSWLLSLSKTPTATPWPVTLQLQDSDVQFKIDSGADITLMSQLKLDHSQAVIGLSRWQAQELR